MQDELFKVVNKLLQLFYSFAVTKAEEVKRSAEENSATGNDMQNNGCLRYLSGI